MLKQIIPMALYMIGILYAIAFGGEKFFPEPDIRYRLPSDPENPYVVPGRPYTCDGSELYSVYKK